MLKKILYKLRMALGLEVQRPVEVKSRTTVSAIVTRADGTVEDLGVISRSED